MIHIFNGREMSLTGARQRLFIQFEKEFLDQYLVFFRHNNSSDSLAVFMAMIGHIDTNGWCFPSHERLHQQTGIKNPHTMGYLISVLNTIVLPMPDGDQKLLNYWSGRLPNGHMKSYYHVFPGAGNEDLAPEPFIVKERMRPGLVQRRPQKRRSTGGLIQTAEAPDEGASDLSHMRESHIGSVPHEALPHVRLSHINYNQESLTRFKPRTSCEEEDSQNIMPLSLIHLTVEQGLNKTTQAAQTFECPHCQATITQHNLACPDCGTKIVWTGNAVLAKDAKRTPVLMAAVSPHYNGMAGWLIEYARAHPAGLANERIFYREDKAHHEAGEVIRFASLFGEQLVRDKAAYAVSKGAVGRGVIVTTLNLLKSHDPTAYVGSKKPKGKLPSQQIHADGSAFVEQAERERIARERAEAWKAEQAAKRPS